MLRKEDWEHVSTSLGCLLLHTFFIVIHHQRHRHRHQTPLAPPPSLHCSVWLHCSLWVGLESLSFCAWLPWMQIHDLSSCTSSTLGITMELNDPVDYEHLPVNENDVRKIVLSYLVHNCFKETAEAFISSTGMKCATDWATELDKRKAIYNYVIKGDALKAIEFINQLDPGLLKRNEDSHFELLTLHFVELIRAKNCTDALEFARKELSAYGKLEKYTEKLQDFVTLLAYEEPEKSPVFQLLSLEHRHNIADSLNRVILAHHKLPSKTALERLVEQLMVVQGYLNQENAKKGLPAVSLKKFFGNSHTH